MNLKEVLPPEIIDYSYNYSFEYNMQASNITQSYDMTPFVYNEPNGLKRLVLVWEVAIEDKSSNTKILELKLEMGHILDCSVKSEEGLERFKKLLGISYNFFQLYYQYLSTSHRIRLKNLEGGYTGLESHYQLVSPLLYGQQD